MPTQLFIGGEWVDSTSGRSIDVHDPSTGAVHPDDRRRLRRRMAPRALDAAVDAQAGWAATAPRVRGEILRGAFDLLQERADEFALLMTLEMGKPLAEARGEVTYGGEFLRWFSEEAVRITGRYGTNPEGTGRMIVTHLPVGPSFLITPWNFPLAMATRKIAPALAAGCTAVIKPAELTPLTTLYFAQLLEDAGLPKGVLNVHHDLDVDARSRADHRRPAPAQAQLHRLDPGRPGLLKQAADNVLRTSMELGGNAPFVVFDDADLDKAVDGAMLAKFRNIGEACTAANRFIVHESVADEFAAALTERVKALKVGRGTEDGVTIGPLINDGAVDKADALVQRRGIARRDAAHRRSPRRGRGHLLRADRAHRGVGGQRHPARGDLRTGRHDRPVHRRGGCRGQGQRHRVRPGELRLHPRPRPRAAPDRVAPDRHDGPQRRASCRTPRRRSAASSSRASAARAASRASTSTSRRSTC